MKNGTLCPRCRRGRIEENEGRQWCPYCGRVFRQTGRAVPFRDLRNGELFTLVGDENGIVYVKCPGVDPAYPLMNMYRRSDPRLTGGCGPIAPVIRVADRRIGDTFTYN